MKTMILNSKIKQKLKDFGSDQKSSSWFHFLLCYYIYYMSKYPVDVTWAQGKTTNKLCIIWGCK